MRFSGFAALRDPAYRAVALGNAVSMIGIWMQKIAVGWLAWELTRSTVWLGLVTAADLLPAVFLSSVFGSLADGRSKARLVLFAQSLAMAQSLVLAALTLAGVIDIWMLLLLSLALGVANSLDHPSRLSLLREIVRPEHLHSAITLNALSYNTARFIGPMVAGFLITRADIGYTFLASAATLGFFAVCLLTVPRRGPPEGSPANMLSGLGDGYRYIASNTLLVRTLFVTITTGVGVAGTVQLLPALAERLFGRGVDGFVELVVSSGLGAISSGIVLLLFPPRRDTFFRIPFCLVAAGIALAIFASTSHYWIGVCALFAAAFAGNQSGVMSQSTLNIESRPEMLGRVMGVYSALVRGAPAIGGFVIGSLAPITGFWPLMMTCAAWMGLYGVWLLAKPAHKRRRIPWPRFRP